MASFPWDYPDGDSWPAPFVRIELFGPRRRLRVSAQFDTGAEVTCLAAELIDILGVVAEDLADQEVVMPDGGSVRGQIAYLQAELDDHVFTLPVIFSDEIDYDVVGRLGIVDQFEITLDGRSETRFRWQGSFEVPWADQDREQLWEARSSAG